MKNNKVYLIYRIYKQNEIEDGFTNHLYGWTKYRSLLKGFLMQRDNKKYHIVKYDMDELADEFSENELDEELEMNYIELKSAKKKGLSIHFYTNRTELLEIETKIQEYFNKLCSFEKYEYETVVNLVNMLSMLEDKYDCALEVIGYRPPEMESLYPGNSESYNDEIMDEILTACTHYSMERKHQAYGVSALSSLPKIILYSLESVVKVCVDDM